ncbi:MAG: sigma-70 family RNA polymerase sigma factor [Vicinamibacteraceae bacterium]
MTRDEFAALALRYLEEFTAFARRLTGNFSDADDLVQDTFTRAFDAWSTLREPRACRAWLFRIARNQFLNDKRAATARPALRLVEMDPESGDLPIVSPEVVERLDAQALETALAQLPDEQREVVLLRDLWGFEYEEIAEITEVPVGTVRSRLARGRGRVITLLAGQLDGRARERR